MRECAALHGWNRSVSVWLTMLPATQAALAQAPAATPPPIRDIAPPLDLFPYPLWMVLIVATVVCALLAVISWFFFRWWRNRPPPAPPTPRSIAMRELQMLRNKLRSLEPYAFSIAVSDVLRTFIGAEYGLHAREQTSPEFLAAAANSNAFSADERSQLARFLEKADMIKFARVDAGEGDSEQLLSTASAFVEGGRL